MRTCPSGVTNAPRRFASPALSGLSTRSSSSRSLACRTQREHRLAGVGVDEDLVAGGGLQRRATLAQRIGGAYEANGVDGVVGERAVRGMR